MITNQPFTDQPSRKNHENKVDYYKIIADLTRELIFIIRKDFTVEFVNNYAAEKLNLAPQEIINQPMESLFPPDIAKRQHDYLVGIFESGEYSEKVSCSNVGGKEVWLDTLFVPYKDVNGATIKVLGISRDITQRIKVEHALKESEEKFRKLVESANDAIYLRDKEGILEYVNPKLLELTGYKEEEMVGKKSWSFLHQDDFRKISEKVNLKEIEETVWRESRIITRYGEVKYLDINTVPFTTSKGEQKILGVARDITERKKMEKALRENEEKYKLLIEEQGEGIGIVDEDEIIRFANPAAEKIFCVKSGGLINRSLQEFTSPDAFKNLKNETLKRKKGVRSRYETEIICGDGNTKILHLTATPKYDKHGNFEGTFGIFRDITEEKKMEEALRVSEERFKRFTAVTNEGIIIHKDGKVIDVNPSLLKLFGYRENEIREGNIFEFISPHYHDFVKEKLSKESDETYEFDAIKKDGTVFPVEVKARSVYINGELYRVVSINDITQRKMDEEALRESEKKLQEANSTKDKFFSILAHDLRGPVSNLMQFSRLVEENYKELSLLEIQEYLGHISRLAGNTFNLLENLLTWSRIQLNKIELTPVEFNLNGVVNSALRLFWDALDKKNINIAINLDKDLKPFADEKAIEVVIRNLLSNAVKFTPRNGDIFISGFRKENHTIPNKYIEFSIKDTGIGIPANHMNDLFRIDTIYSTPGTEKEKGTGLGLILCKEFVEKNGGTMGFKSKSGEGSTFYFTIPEKK
jgi:PAS domain S-box-containing protein